MSLKNPFPRPDEPAPPRPVGRSEEETRVSPSDLLRALWDARWLLLVGSLGLAFVTLVVSSFLPKTYEARAKLLVMPPPFKTEMHPPLLSVETYRELADSTTIKTRVVEQLSDKGLTRNGSLNGMKTSLSASSIPGQPFSPLVELIVEASSAELAQAAVTLWGEIFVRENSNISSEGKVESVEFIQSQYPLITNALGQTERKLKETQDTYEQNDVGFNNTWDQRLANDALETQRLLADRKLETERLLLEFNLETNQKFLKFTEETADLLKDYQLETQRL
ncbi:MAG: Wzz/FepE/Etk N-terminal domain-containing protein, partial [Acidobacteriota bacterium]